MRLYLSLFSQPKSLLRISQIHIQNSTTKAPLPSFYLPEVPLLVEGEIQNMSKGEFSHQNNLLYH